MLASPHNKTSVRIFCQLLSKIKESGWREIFYHWSGKLKIEPFWTDRKFSTANTGFSHENFFQHFIKIILLISFRELTLNFPVSMVTAEL